MIICGLINGQQESEEMQQQENNTENNIANDAKNSVEKQLQKKAIKFSLKTLKTIFMPVIILLLKFVLVVVLVGTVVSILASFFNFLNDKTTNKKGTLTSTSDYIVKTDEPDAAPVPTKSELESGITAWLSSKNKQAEENALSVVDDAIELEKEYNVNPVFIYALMMTETTIGTADTTWVRENNWCSLTGLGHKQYETPGENMKVMANIIANGKDYFTQGLYSVYEIGEVYCTDPPPPAWADEVSGYMTDLYLAMGYTVGTDNSGNLLIGTGHTFGINLFKDDGSVDEAAILRLRSKLEIFYNLPKIRGNFTNSPVSTTNYISSIVASAGNKKYNTGGWSASPPKVTQCPWWAVCRTNQYLESNGVKYKSMTDFVSGKAYGNGGQWTRYADYFNSGTSPKSNSILTTTATGGSAGHVAYVEAYDSSTGYAYISHCGSGKKWYGIYKVKAGQFPWYTHDTLFIYLDEPK